MGIYVGDKRYAPYIGDKRRRYMGGKVLPYDKEVEYLTGSRTAYIATNIYLTNKHSVELKVSVTSVSANQAIFGYGISNTNSRFLLMTNTSSRLTAFWTGTTRSLSGYAANTVYEVIWHKKNVVFKDDAGNVLSSGDLTDLDFTTTYPIDIFGTRTGETSHGYQAGRIYYFKIYDENDVLILDLIPVRKGTVGYMFDRVSNSLISNSGSGSFGVGPDKT